jgi:hypothetical protein
VTCLLNKTKLLNRTFRNTQKSQSNFKVKMLSNKPQIHSSLPKENTVEPTSDIYLNSKQHAY